MVRATEKEIIKQAESWVGTPYCHGQYLKGVGADCAGLSVAVWKELEWLPRQYKPPVVNRDWGLHNDVSAMAEEVTKFADRVVGELRVGDLLLFKNGKCAAHSGIYIGNNKMIHCTERRGVSMVNVSHHIKRSKQAYHSSWRVKNGR